jgi:hypothetical protein
VIMKDHLGKYSNGILQTLHQARILETNRWMERGIQSHHWMRLISVLKTERVQMPLPPMEPILHSRTAKTAILHWSSLLLEEQEEFLNLLKPKTCP